MSIETDDMRSYLTAQSPVDTARMLETDHMIRTVWVEGETDKAFWDVVMKKPDEFKVCPQNGWENVYNAVDLAIQQGDRHVLGIIDRDYHELLHDGISENGQLIFTDFNDMEMMLFMSSSFNKFLDIFASADKLNGIGDRRSLIMEAASFIGALRALSLQHKYCICFEDDKCKDYVDYRTLSVNVKEFVRKVVQRTITKGTPVDVDISELALAVESFTKENKPEVLCNGHDVMEIIAIAMRKVYATASSSEYNSDRVFRILLQGYTSEEFQKSRLFSKLDKWLKSEKEVA